MKTTIKITGIEEAVSQAGKSYWKVQTNNGLMSCFDKLIIDKIEVGKVYEAEVISSKDGVFKNIRKISSSEYPVESIESVNKFTEAREAKNTAMYISYAKDLIISGMKPDEAILTVKKLIDSF